MADKQRYEQKIDLVVETEKAKKQFREFTEDIKINFKSNVQKAFSGVETKSVDKLNKIVSQLSAKKIDSSKYQEFFDKISKAADLAASKISRKYVTAIQRLSKAHQDGKISSREFESRLDKLKIKFSRELPQAVNKFKNSVEKSTLALKAQTAKAGVVSKALAAFAKRIGIFFTYRIISAITQAVGDLAKQAIDLESQFANIQAITNSSNATMSKLRDTILKVGEASKYSTEEIAESTVMLGQAGLDAEEINNVLETTTQLAAGTGSELSNTVDLMTSALAVWGVNSEEASHLSDVMVTGMNRTKATLETFRMAVQYAGATAASLNVNFEELAAVASAASNAGLRASVVGTGLRATMAELISPTKKMIDGLASLGLKTSDVDIASRGLIPVLKTLKDAGLDASTAYELFGRRAATFVLAAQGQLDKIDELQLAFTEQGATLKAYGVQMNTISAKATALGNTIKAISSDVLDYFSGIIKGFLDLVNLALKGLRYIFSDKDKIDFEEKQFSLNNDIKSSKAFDKYLNGIKEGLEKDGKAGEKLNAVIDKINKQFDTNIEHIKSTEKLADAWNRVKDSINNIKEDKIKELDFEKNIRRTSIYRKAYRSELLNRTDTKGMEGALKLENYLIKHEGDSSAIEERIENFNKSGRVSEAKQLSKALEVARQAYSLSENKTVNSLLDLSESEESIGGGTGGRTGRNNEKEKKEKLDWQEYLDMGFSGEDAQSLYNKIEEFNAKIAEDSKTAWGSMRNGVIEYSKELNKTVGDMGKILSNFSQTGLSIFTDSITTAFTDIAKGTSSVKDAFKTMVSDILTSLGTYLIKVGVMAAVLAALSSIPGVSAALQIEDLGAKAKTVADAAEYSKIAANATGEIGKFTSSGETRKAGGGYISGGIPNRDSVNAKLMPGEYVLKKSAVDALGTNFLNDLNNNTAQTLTNAASSLMEQNPWEESSSEPAVVNVWVVSKEEEAKMGPNDVIATISKDIMTGGQTRRLIQSVVAGRK